MISFAKKFLSIALAAVLLLSVFPMAAAAEEVVALQYMKVLDKDGNTAEGGKRMADNSTGDYVLQAEDLPMPGYDAPEGVTFTGKWKKLGDSDTKVLAADQHVPFGTKIVPIFTVTAPPAPACEHKHPKDVIVTASTCTKTGTKNVICEDCGETISSNVDLPLADHNYVLMSIPSTCKVAGEEWYECSVCHAEKEGSRHALPLAAHKYETVTETAPTCIKEGAEYKKCSVCGDITDIKTLAKVDHTWGEYHTVKEASAIKEGVEERACQVCGKTETRAIPKTGAAILSWNITFDENLPSEYKNSTRTSYEIKDGQRIGSLFSKGMPIPSCNRYTFKGWYLTNPDESLTNVRVTGETIYDFGRHVTLKAVWEEEARVKLFIFRNGNTDNPYDTIQLYGYGVGDVINTNNLNIKDYYKNGDKPFKWEGWFDREGWTYFKAKENAKPISSIRTVGLDGTTTLFAMVYDDNAPASNKTPDHTNPKTGDESMILATTAVMLVSAGALAVFFMDRKRRNG